jgi:hypothetical protein
MEKPAMHTETRYDDLSGTMSVNFRENEGFEQFVSRVAGVDLSRYQPVAMRLYVDKEAILTVYATDRSQTMARENSGKLQVRKFKINVSLEELFSSFRQLDFTLLKEGYAVDTFEVIDSQPQRE